MKPPFIYLSCAGILMMVFGTVLAQAQPCNLVMQYDANGQRIKRFVNCEPENNPANPGPHFYPLVYPNPTVGGLTVAYNELVLNVRLQLTNMQGDILSVVEDQATSRTQLDISSFVPGTYLLSIFARREDYTDATETVSIIKIE
jgi:hypothetical protein